MTHEKEIKYFSTFSGIGGFELGIDRAHRTSGGDVSRQSRRPSLRTQRYQSKPQDPKRRQYHPTCVGFSEIDKYAAQIYQRHFPAHKNYGDITAIDARALPDFDLYVGGFPCQAFSIAGKRLGFEDTRGTLFFDVARILQVKRPRHFVLENVKGLLSHGEGRTFKKIISTLVELGYSVEWQVLNSKDFGVPQNRERVFIVGHFGGTCGRQVFPLADDADVLDGTDDANKGRPQAKISHTLRDSNIKADQTFILHENKGGHLSKRSSSAALRSGASANYQTVNAIRRLTPVECERLQGFADGWTEGVSDTQRYKTLGNAVTVNVVAAVILRLYS